MSDIGFGPDATVNVEVTGDADALAREVNDALEKAVLQALKSPQVQNAVNAFVNNLTKAMGKIGKEQQQTVKQMTQGATKAAQQVGKIFDEVSRKSRAALNFNQARGSSNELQALNALVASLSANFEHLATDVRTTNTVLKEMGSGARAQLAAIERERRSGVLAQTTANAAANTASQKEAAQIRKEGIEAAAAARVQSAIIRTSSAERVAQIRRFTQIATTSIRSLTQVFRTVFNTATSIVRSFVNGATSLLSGIGKGLGRGLSAAFRGLQTTARTAMSGLSRIFSSGNSKDEAAWKSSLSRREHALRTSLNNQSNAIQSFQQRTSRGILGGITGRGALGIGAGLAGGAGLGALLTSGFERAGQVEQLQLTFTALLGDGDQAAAVLERLSNFARTTSFDFIEVAQSTAQLTAALGDVDQAEHLTKFLADVVALTGGTTEALGRVRLAMSQIAGAGRLDSANLRQITESLPGVPIAQILADRFFGGSIEAYSAARDAGELGGTISAEAFFEAFEAGTKEKFPAVEGFAQVAAGTLTGMTQNLKENFAIFGATIIGLAAGPIKAGIGALNTFLGLAGEFVSGEMFSTSGGTTPWGSTLFKPLSDNLEKLKTFREILGNILKTLGVLLAFKGAAEVFGLIGTGISLALTPMGLLVVAATAITAAWTLFLKSSEKFASVWTSVKNQFKAGVGAFLNLGKAIRTAFGISFGGDGSGPSLLTRLGDGFTVVNNYLRRIFAGFTTFANTLSGSLSTEGFANFFSQIDEAVGRGLEEVFIGPLAQGRRRELEAQGGSLILNVLEATFLGPIVRFFRGPFLDAAKTVISFISGIIGQIASAVGDIWGIVFDDEDQDPQRQLVNRIFGTGDDRSTGTKILDRLEETFLGPIVRFFRGPFADAIEGVGAFIGSLFQNFVIPGFKGIFNFFAHDFIPGLVNVAQSIGTFLSPAIHTIGDLAGQVGTLLAPIGGAIQGFVDTWQNEGVGAAFSSLWDGIVEAAGNLWEGEDGSGGIKAGLESALNSITSWFSSTFTGENAAGWALSALEGLRIVGEKVGRFLSSPEFLGTVIIATAAIAGTIAAIIGAFTVGFVQGVAAEVPRWANIISDGLTAAWNALSGGALDFLPGPVVDAISSALGSPLVASGIAVGTIALGGVITTSLFSAITNGMVRGPENGAQTRSFANLGINIAQGLFGAVVNGLKGLRTGGINLAQMIVPRLSAGNGSVERAAGAGIGSRIMNGMSNFFRTVTSPLSALSSKLQTAKATATANFGSVGVAIGTAIVGGIAAFEFGQYAGKTGDAGKMILSLLGGGATGAAIGTAILPGFGTAIGAALGVGISAIGIAFGQASKQAEELRDNINEIRDALTGLSGEDINTALFEVVTDRLLSDPKAFADWGQALVDSGFDFRNFTDQIVAGTGEADVAFTDFLGRMGDELGAAGGDVEFFNEMMRKLAAAASTGNYTSLSALYEGAGLTNQEYTKLGQTMEVLGITGGDLNNIFGFLQDGVEGGTSAFKLLNTETEILKNGLDAVVNPLDTVEEALAAIQTSLTAGDSAEQIAAILSNPDLASADALKALGDAADEAAKKLDAAKEAFTEALDAVDVGVRDVGAKTFEGITNQIIGDLPQIAAGFQQIYDDINSGEIAVNVGNARLVGDTEDFKGQITGLISEAVDAGLITDDASMDVFLNNIKTQINSAGLEPEIAAMLNGVVDAFISGDYTSLLDPILAQMTNQEKIAEAGRLMAERLRSAFSTTLGAAQALGGPAALGSLVGTGSSQDTISPPKVDLTNLYSPAEATAVGEALGGDIGEGVDPGFKGADIASGLKNEVNAAGNSLHGSAQSNGFRTGLTFATAIGTGVTTAAGNAAAAAGSVVKRAVQAASGGQSAMYNQGVNLANALASGIYAATGNAVTAARSMAEQVAQAARVKLKIKSPSLVFRDIGKQIGAGFVKGIEDSTVSMTNALETALETAITAAVDKAYVAVNRANVASRLFDLLQPSALPGGTSTLELSTATAGVTGSLGSFLPDLRAGFADALGGVANDALREANEAVAGIGLDISSAFADLRGQYADAANARDAIADYNTALATLRTQLNNGTLATQAANKARAEAYKDLVSDQQALNDKIARLRVQLNNGTIAGKTAAEKLATFNEKVKDLKDSFNATSVEHYNEELDRINRAFKNGTLAQEEYRRQLDELGSRPDALSFEQQNILASGVDTLNVGTLAGRANRDTLSDALGDIREWGQAALEAGASLPYVISNMEVFTDRLVAQAKAMGLSAAEVNTLVSLFGLTDAQLKKLQQTLTSLDVSTVQGAANVARVNEQLQGLRDYAATLLEAGQPISAVIAKIKELRNQLIAQAKAAGFNAASIAKLVAAAGLSDSALAAFIKQLNDYTKAVNGATQATPDTASTDSSVSRPRGEQTFNIHLPYGDPEAVALAVANREAFAGPTSW